MTNVPDGQEVFYGGPYMQESEAIEAELLHAFTEDREPDLWSVFKDKPISNGAVELIRTHLEGHPTAGYQGERVSGENVELPNPDYVFPGDGGLNTVDIESSPTLTVVDAPVEAVPVEEPQGKHVAESPELDAVISEAENSENG